MPLASYDRSITKSVACVDSFFTGFMPVSLEPLLKLTERKAHRFSISNSQTKNASAEDWFSSPDFTVGGFQWYILFCPRGRPGGDGQSIALYLNKRIKSADVVVAVVRFQLLDKSGKSAISASLICNFTSPLHSSNIRGWSGFATRSYLESYCVQGDNIVIDCELAIYERSGAGNEEKEMNSILGVVLPSKVNSVLPTLLEETEMKDVTFVVDGEEIAAHKLVFAARSPVFKAQLYGQMSGSNTDCIPITDMKASVFRVLLYYIYTDSLPENAKLCISQSDSCSQESSIAAQHLLEAADRYGLDRLKFICEDNLCRTLNVDTVATTLALAHQHDCNHLKAACLEFMLDPVNFVKVALTQGYIHLRQICPEVMSEDYQRSIVDKITRASSTQ